MEGIINFHNYIMFFMIGIGIFVFWLLIRCFFLYNEASNSLVDNFTHSTILEIVWTIVPASILYLIAIPSFALLYAIETLTDVTITLKIIGNQWYWSYEFSDYEEVDMAVYFDSYMRSFKDLQIDSYGLRLLETDNRIVLPVSTHIRLLISSVDVLHSWAMPSFGVKSDACPGRLNQSMLFLTHTGIFFGQCSELCGTNHGFMPICVEVAEMKRYLDWIEDGAFMF